MYELAGFTMAHGLWFLSEGHRPLPMGAYVSADRRGIVRFADNPYEPAIAQARRWFGSNAPGAQLSALLSEGRAWLSEGVREALIADLAVYGVGPAGTVVLPLLATNSMRFTVQQPAINPAAELVPYVEELAVAFERGLRGHERGNMVFEEARAAMA